jgi:uncharacterized protein YaiI (UPF0178 family)
MEINMRILVDADALPRELKEALWKIAEREQVMVIMVANQHHRLPVSNYISGVVAPSGFNAADDRIVELIQAGDLVITADIPLADRALSGGASAVNSRGELFSAANIKNRLAMRELMEDLRAGGEITGGPPPYNRKHRENFVNQIDRLLRQSKRNTK